MSNTAFLQPYLDLDQKGKIMYVILLCASCLAALVLLHLCHSAVFGNHKAATTQPTIAVRFAAMTRHLGHSLELGPRAC